MKLSSLAGGVIAAAAIALPATAGEFQGTAISTWAVSGPVIVVEGGGSYSISSGYGVNLLETDDPTMANIANYCVGWFEVDGSNAGRCSNVDLEGNEWFEHYECEADGVISPTPPGALMAIECTTTITGGTGKFANITGGGTFTQLLLYVYDDGTAVGMSPTHYDMQW